MNLTSRTLLALLLLSTIAIAQSESAPAPKLSARPASEATAVLPKEETVNAFLTQTFGYDNSISWKIVDIRPSEIAGLADVTVLLTNPQGSNQTRLLVTSDGKRAITGDILPFGAKPFEASRAKLEKGVNGPAKGPAKATVTVVEFSDMQCPHCQKAAPTIDKLLAEEPDVHFVFQNFPLPSHNWAEKAAAYLDCIGRSSNDAVWTFIQKTFDDQANITEANSDEKLKGIATAAGANADETAACAAKPDTKARIEASMALGRSVGVSGTPTLFINGRNVPAGAPLELLKKIVDFHLAEEKAAK